MAKSSWDVPYLSGAVASDLMLVAEKLEEINAGFKSLRLMVHTGEVRWSNVYRLRTEVNRLSSRLEVTMYALRTMESEQKIVDLAKKQG